MQPLKYERVIYDNNPLFSVACQLTFPSVLSIESKLPDVFQDRIRHQYPEFKENRGLPLAFGFPNVIDNPPIRVGNVTYQFVANEGEGRTWTISLAHNSLALGTTHYERWEQFLDHLEGPLAALNEIYQPAYFTRIGLRYQNAIVRSKLGLSNSRWNELLNPNIVTVFNITENDNDIEASTSQSIVSLGEGKKVQVILGLGMDNAGRETVYVVDNDFYIEQRVEVSDAKTKLAALNRQSGPVFRWCISDTLHDAMGPERLSSIGG